LQNVLKEYIPLHRKLKLVNFSEQRLSLNTSRLLVTMKLISDKEKLEKCGGVGAGENVSVPNDEITNVREETKITHINNFLLDEFRDKYFSKK